MKREQAVIYFCVFLIFAMVVAAFVHAALNPEETNAENSHESGESKPQEQIEPLDANNQAIEEANSETGPNEA